MIYLLKTSRLSLTYTCQRQESLLCIFELPQLVALFNSMHTDKWLYTI